MKKVKRGALLLTIVIIAIFAINKTFVFNPVTSSKIIGTELSWYEYRKPLRIDYQYWYRGDSEPKLILCYDEEELKFILKELNRSEKVTAKPSGERFVWFHIKRLSDSRNLMVVDVSNNKIADIGNNTYVRITDELWNYLSEVEQREQNAAYQ